MIWLLFLAAFPNPSTGNASGAIPVYSGGSLPAVTAQARIAKLSSGSKGLLYSDGYSWVPISGLDSYVIEDFGGKDDAGVTDNLAAWNAIMATIQRNTSGYGVQSGPNGSIIRFASRTTGVYNFSDTPVLSVSGCIVEGAGGAYSGQRTLLTVPAGKIGFIVGDTNQDGGTGTGAVLRNFGLSGNGYLVGGAQSNINVNGWQATHAYTFGDIIQPTFTVNNGSKWGGYLWKDATSGTHNSGGSQPSWPIANTLSTYTETNPTQSDGSVTWQAIQAHGLVLHGTVHAENITVSAFAGDCIHNYGDTTNSNTDLSTFVNVNASSCYGNGFWTAGNDSAPSTFIQCNSLSNFGYGYYDFSLEGNIYIDCHARSNGSEAWLPTNSPTLNTFMSPTVPNDYLYMATPTGTTGSTEPSWNTTIGTTTTSGTVSLVNQRHYSGGPYYMRNSGLLACYDEGGQQPNILSTTAAWSKGGSHGAGFVADTDNSLGRVEQSRFNNSSFATISDNGDGKPVETWVGSRNTSKIGWSVAPTIAGSPVSGADLDLVYSSGNTFENGWRLRVQNAGGGFNVCDGTESGTVAGDIQFLYGLWIGGPQTPGGSVFMSASSVVPSSGAHTKGDFVFNTNPSVGGIMGWQCVSGGTPGTWTAIYSANETLLSSTVVDLSLSSKQPLYTVPSAQSLIVTKVIARSPSVTITTATGGIGFNAGATDVVTSPAFPVASTTYAVTLAVTGTAPTIGTATSILGFKTTATQAATMTIDVFGYHY